MAKIIQILIHSQLLGLGDDGVVYVANNEVWEEFMEGLPSKDITPANSTIARQKRFTPPTHVETCNYMQERGLSLDQGIEQSDSFCDFYTSKDWMVGKNKMKDWKAAVRNWLKNYKPTTGLNMDNTDWINDMGEVL